MPTLPSFLDHRLLFFTGKGGVGKTTVSLACAMRAAAEGKKVLLAFVAPTPWVADLFNLKSFSHIPTSVSPNLDMMEIDPKQALQEYFTQEIHIKKIAELVTNNRLVSHFLDAVPGLKEILILGKIYDLAKRRVKGLSNSYDLIIVDAPATGHGISMIQVPVVVKNAIPAGPLHTQTSRMLSLFSDPELCRLCIVTLAEDMPVQESVELAHTLQTQYYLNLGPVFLNGLLKPLPKTSAPYPANASFDAARFYEKRTAIQRHYRTVLEDHFETLVPLPFVTSPRIGRREMTELSKMIT